MTQFNLHKLPEGFIITSDGVVTHGDGWYNPITGDMGTNWYEKGIPKEWSKTLKVIAQQDQIDFSALSEEEQKEIGWFDVEKLAETEYPFALGGIGNSENDRKNHFIKGFKKAQELLSDRRFTLEDVRKALELKNPLEKNDYTHTRYLDSDELIIQSLSQPKSWPIECIEDNGKIKITKIT
jgi:hypothetical protein